MADPRWSNVVGVWYWRCICTHSRIEKWLIPTLTLECGLNSTARSRSGINFVLWASRASEALVTQAQTGSIRLQAYESELRSMLKRRIFSPCKVRSYKWWGSQTRWNQLMFRTAPWKRQKWWYLPRSYSAFNHVTTKGLFTKGRLPQVTKKKFSVWRSMEICHR